MNAHRRILALLLALVPAVPAPAQQWTSRIPLPGDDAVGPAPGVQQKCELARGGDAYLAVWEDTRAAELAQLSTGIVHGLATNPIDLYAARLDARGAVLDPLPLVVASGPFNQERARVAWNGATWLVVFESRRATAFSTTKGIYAVRVSAAGQVLDPTPILVDDDDSADESGPAIASDGSNWAIVWTDLVNGQDWIQGALVSPAGQVLSKRLVLTGGVFLFPQNPSIAWAQNRYLLAFNRYTSGAPLNQYDDVYGRFLDATLAPFGTDFAIAATPGAQTHPWVATDGASFLVAWNFVGAWCTPVGLNGGVAVPGGLQLGVTGSAVAPRAAWDGASWDVTWAGQGIQAARVDPAGAPVGSTFQVEPPPGTGFSLASPSVCGGAGAPGEAVFAWHDPGAEDLSGRRLDASGATGPRFDLATGIPGQVLPDVDGDAASGYLVVFASETSTTRRVVAQRVGAGGAPLDPQPIELASGGRELGFPHVAWDGARWLVVWHVLPTPANGLAAPRSFGRRVRADGTVLDAAPVDLLPGKAPDASALNGFLLVVSTETQTTQSSYVRCVRVDGASGAPEPVVRTIGWTFASQPRVDVLGGRWLVAFNKSVSHDSSAVRVQAAFVEATGIPNPEFEFASNTAREHEPVIAHLGNVALVAYGDGNVDVWMRRMRDDGTFLDGPAGIALTSAPNVQFTPAVASDGSGWLAAWNDERLHGPLEAMVGDVYGTRIDAGGLVLDPSGLAFAHDPALPEGNPALAGDGGAFLLATAEVDRARASTRLFVRVASGAAPFAAFCAGDGLDPNVSTPCPCGNTGGSGRGCANSVQPLGALLAASGSALPDPGTGTDGVVLAASGMPAVVGSIYLQGDARTEAVFGDGVRCVGGGLIRLRTKISAGGASRFPEPGDPSVSQRGNVVPGSGAVRWYQTYYRNASAGFCPPETFNVTNGVQITW